MPEREIPPATLEGWFVLHQLFRLDRKSLKRLPVDAARKVGQEFRVLTSRWADLQEEGWSGSYRMVGGGGDLLLLHFRSSLEALADAEREVARSQLGDWLELRWGYLSVVELGLYGVTAELAARLAARNSSKESDAWPRALEAALEEQRAMPYVQERLRPRAPEEMPYVCVYPMNKRREAGRNWYTLPLAERSAMMHEHGRVGRGYARRISQVISGSVGLDDWEWLVTLFGKDPLAFKEVVTEMRYDRVSAEFAEFGPFYVGFRWEPAVWEEPETW